MHRPRAALLSSLALLLACGGPGQGKGLRAGETRTDAPGSASSEIVDDEAGLPSWGPQVPSVDPAIERALLEAELQRDSRHPALAEALASEGGTTRVRALWSLARIGDARARDVLLRELDGDRPDTALAAIALLEPPPSDGDSLAEPGQPGQAQVDAWSALEDALWTRLALSDPQALAQVRALLLAIARTGGPRTIERFALELAEQPQLGDPPEQVARWTASMQALGLVCARGQVLDDAGVFAILDGLEREQADAAEAAAYALTRCARSSGELLAESREAIVTRLTPFVRAGRAQPGAGLGPQHAALAWKALAALGELPAEPVIAELGLLSSTPPHWTVEVEAVRALGESRFGRALIRSRLAALDIAAFAGPRQHVLLAALQAMRSGIAGDPATSDAELLQISEWLIAGRRSEDPRARKLAALGLCELRLLQAIRNGTPELVRACSEVADAPKLELSLALLTGFEVEALLRAVRANTPGAGGSDLGTVAIDDATLVADQGEPPPEDPQRKARVGALLRIAEDPQPARAAVALQALAEIDDARVAPVLRLALASDDVGVLAAAATTIALRSIDAGKRDLDAVPELERLVRERKDPGALEVRLSAIEALGALARAGTTPLSPLPGGAPQPATSEPLWLERTILPLARASEVAVRRKARAALLGHAELLRRFDADEAATAAARRSPFPESLTKALERAPAKGLRVHTEAGVFTIDFAGVAAPINQANLVALAEADYFNGLDFHRVVPGFVVQGGDPRGDGYGGPGYLVPCEWSNLRYVRGTVGIALAGKDTGGSQFFVTHTAQPHLDARYSVVGQVDEAGMVVVDSLLPSDRILRVEVL